MALTTEGEVLLELNLAFNAADGRRLGSWSPADHNPCGFRLGGRLLLFPDLMVQAISLPYMMPGSLTKLQRRSALEQLARLHHRRDHQLHQAKLCVPPVCHLVFF